MTELTHLSLFSGIGGLDLAAEAAGFTSVGQCEWADYPTKVLEKHWPDVPRWRDIRTLTGDDFYARTGRRSVTVISGGFPCQPFSVAGKRRGKEDDRYLWPEMCRVISEIRPSWVVGENVSGIVNLALDTVLSDLESQGYTCQTFIIPACGVDAPHRRERICIVGSDTRSGERKPQCKIGKISQQNAEPGGVCADVSYTDCDGRNAWRPESEGQQRKAGAANGSYDVADTESNITGRLPIGAGTQKPGFSISSKNVSDSDNTTPTRYGIDSGKVHEKPESERLDLCSGTNWWPAEPNVGRVANGIPSRVDRLKCLGNAVVPQQFYPFFKFIAEIEESAYWREGE